MLSFLKKSKQPEDDNNSPEKQGLFSRLSSGLKRTRSNFTSGLADVMLGKKVIDDELLEELEMQLLTADVGVDAAKSIIDQLAERVKRRELSNPEALIEALKATMVDLLAPVSVPLNVENVDGPFVILMVGVNGAGKTTTIGKLAKRLQAQGKSVMLAAGDTFRAAAVEQLQVWGERNDIAVVAQAQGADSASVIFDALQAAKSRQVDVLIADTAGRLHTQTNLMEELKKIKRVIQKLDDTAPHEALLVLDAGIGQNALRQVEQFNQAVDVSGIAFTKLDGTAKGGIVFAIAEKFAKPIRFIGVGEAIDDLQSFDAKNFVGALFGEES